jgi:ADP-heptose:LPS heptosyltransferase
VITGSVAEQELARRVVGAAGHAGVRSAAGLLGLDELAALVAAAGLVVCGDTGVAHLATAYGTPSVVLFGPTPPALWGPPAFGPHRVIWRGGCGDPHADRPDPGLLAIGVDEVLTAVETRTGSLPSPESGPLRQRHAV